MMHPVPRQASWFLVFLATGSLLTLFFTYPFERIIFGPLALLIGAVTFFSPPAGLGLFLLSTLTTLQLPILLDLPFFSGAEPGFLAMTAAVALRNLTRPREIGLPGPLAGLLLTHAGAVLASSLFLWASYWQLPGDWCSTLTTDALSKIHFWRWGNPFNFLRMTLLLLEGPAAFLVALYAYRCDPRRTLLYLVAAFCVLGGLVAGYSAVELLLRGKEISWYPGFGPVFADRNAYAAFWVILVPIALALALHAKGLARLGGGLLAGASWLFCALSLSISGIAGILFATGAFLALRPGRWSRAFRYGLTAALILATGLLASATWFLARNPDHFRVLAPRLEERISFWAPAVAMVADRPLLGLGPGEFYRRVPEYRARLDDLPPSAFERENVHNYYLQLAVGTGLVGTLPFLLIAAYLLRAGLLRLRDPQPREPDAGAPDSPQWSLLDWFRVKRAESLAMLLAALAGLLFFSITQHPMLRFPFQTYYWIFAAVIAGLALSPNAAPVNRKVLLFPAGVVLLALVAQSLLSPPPPLHSFRYGFHELEEEEVLATEGVAFLRTPWDRSKVGFELRAAAGNQTVEIHLNGQVTRFEVSDDRWFPFEGDPGGAEVMDLGLVSRPVLPRSFPNTWGAGVRVRGLAIPTPEP